MLVCRQSDELIADPQGPPQPAQVNFICDVQLPALTRSSSVRTFLSECYAVWGVNSRQFSQDPS